MAYAVINGGRGGIHILRNRVDGEGGAQTKGLFANNSIDSCTKAAT